MKTFVLTIAFMLAWQGAIAQGEEVKDFFFPMGGKVILKGEGTMSPFVTNYTYSGDTLFVDEYVDNSKVSTELQKLDISHQEVKIMRADYTSHEGADSGKDSIPRPLLILPEANETTEPWCYKETPDADQYIIPDCKGIVEQWRYRDMWKSDLECTAKRVTIALHIGGKLEDVAAIEVTELCRFVNVVGEECSWGYKYYWVKNYGLTFVLVQADLYYTFENKALPIYHMMQYNHSVMDSAEYHIKG